MTVRNPLVLIPGGNPQIQELPAGDTIGGAPTGQTGPAGTIEIGTVTTVDPGDPATVTNVGTDTAAILDFEIPQGETGSSGGGDFIRITETVTSSSAANVTFSSIANTYRDLQIRVRARGDTSATNVGVLVQFNADTGSNYDYEDVHAFSSGSSFVQTTAATSLNIGTIAAATAPASVPGNVILDVFDYRGTTFNKSTSSRWGTKIGTSTFSQGVGINSGAWRSSSAITSVKVFLSAGNFVNGSIVTLYGIN